jgi:hypothetical protein
MAPTFGNNKRRNTQQPTRPRYRAFATPTEVDAALQRTNQGIPDGMGGYPSADVLDAIDAYDGNATLPPISQDLRSPYMDMLPYDFATNIPNTPMSLNVGDIATTSNNPYRAKAKSRATNVEGLGNYYDVLRGKESTNNYRAVNSRGYLGGYQMREKSLIDAGMVKPGTTKKGLDNPKNWYNGLSKEKFLASPEIQDAAVMAFTEKNKKYLGDAYKNATELERRGLLASAHLIGAGGTKANMKSVDGNNISGQDYYDYFITH